MNIMEINVGKNGDTNGQIVIVENNKVYTKKFSREKGVLYKKDNLMRCSCKYDGKNQSTATLFKYENGKMFCPDCDKNVEIMKTIEEFKADEKRREQEKIERQEKARANVHLCLVDSSISSGITYYELSTRVEYETWKEIKDLFFYMTYDEDDEEQDTFGMTRLEGWLTTQPEKVEERLKVKPELRLNYRRKEADEKRKAKEELTEKINESFSNIKNEFKKSVQPWADETQKGSQGASLIPYPDGEELEDPKYPFDIYGGGRSWIINKEENKIWQIDNNGHDGDDWGRNNVATGGAGAIGVYVPYNEKLETLIRNYVKLF